MLNQTIAGRLVGIVLAYRWLAVSVVGKSSGMLAFNSVYPNYFYANCSCTTLLTICFSGGVSFL